MCSTYGPDESFNWLAELAKRYRDLRIETLFPITNIDLAGLQFDKSQIEARLTQAAIPSRGSGNFSVARSDFGETIAHCLLEDIFETKFGYKALRDRELVNLPGRGIDSIGVETNGKHIRLILGETKASSDRKSPPQVVDTANDGLRNQHLGHVQNNTITINKVLVAARHARDRDTQDLLFAAALGLESNPDGTVELVTFSCLVRQGDCVCETDPGSFKDSPHDYLPSVVRFILFSVPGQLEEVVDHWIALAQAQEEGDA